MGRLDQGLKLRCQLVFVARHGFHVYIQNYVVVVHFYTLPILALTVV
jgi:hypothetical protein